jgi:hypothetical protein
MAIEFNNLISSRQRGATTTIGLVWYSPASKNRIRGPDLKKIRDGVRRLHDFFCSEEGRYSKDLHAPSIEMEAIQEK